MKTDESLILSAGMDVRSAPSFQTQPAGALGNLSVSQSDHEGAIDAHWDTVKGASYEIQQSIDPAATSWMHAAVSVKSSVTITGLVSGTRYWFRVAAVTSAVRSAWSDPATKIAPLSRRVNLDFHRQLKGVARKRDHAIGFIGPGL